MIDPRIGEQLELFPETMPEQQQREKTKQRLTMEEQRAIEIITDMIEEARESVAIGEDKEEIEHWLVEDARSLGVPDAKSWVREWVIPVLKVPNADLGYLLEYLLGSLEELWKSPLLEKYIHDQRMRGERE